MTRFTAAEISGEETMAPEARNEVNGEDESLWTVLTLFDATAPFWALRTLLPEDPSPART